MFVHCAAENLTIIAPERLLVSCFDFVFRDWWSCFYTETMDPRRAVKGI